MVTTGLALAVLSNVGFYLIYRKLPRSFRNWMQRHALLTDFIICVLTYILFGGTLVALFAAAWAGIIVSIWLALLNNPVTAELLERWGAKLAILREKFMVWAQQQAQKQLDKQDAVTVNQ